MERKDGNLRVKRLDFACEFKGMNDTGTFEGYAAVFGNVDQGFDIIERNAFEDIAKTKDGHVRILLQHDMRQPIGKAMVQQDDHGLKFQGQLLMDNAAARNAYPLMKAGILDGMSIGFDILPDGSKVMDSGVRKLTRLKLWEISVVTFGMNQLALIDTVKSFPNFSTIREVEDWLRDELSLSSKAAKDLTVRIKKALDNGGRDDPGRDGLTEEQLAMKEALLFLNTQSLSFTKG